MKKTILIIILLIVSACSQESRIKAEIDKANFCTKKEDCTFIDHKCPFGCYIYVNKDKVDEVKQLLDSYVSTCMYACIPCQEVKCFNNKCEAVCE